jgi:hypothetical protein
MQDATAIQRIASRYASLSTLMDERMRRQWADDDGALPFCARSPRNSLEQVRQLPASLRVELRRMSDAAGQVGAKVGVVGVVL